MSHSKYKHLSESVCKCGTKMMTMSHSQYNQNQFAKVRYKNDMSHSKYKLPIRLSLPVWYKNDEIMSHSKYNNLSEFFFKD